MRIRLVDIADELEVAAWIPAAGADPAELDRQKTRLRCHPVDAAGRGPVLAGHPRWPS